MQPDLSQDELSFLIEASDFEQSFSDLIYFVHCQHPEYDLAAKYRLAQQLVTRLVEKGLLKCLALTYVDSSTNHLEVADRIPISFDVVLSVWSNPLFWESNHGSRSAYLVGVVYSGPASVMLAPTEAGELLLDRYMASQKEL